MTFDLISYNEARLAKLAALRNSPPAVVKLFPANDTYVMPFDGMVDMLLVGAGPSGGITFGNGCVGGGGAAECAVLLGKPIAAGTVLTVTVGLAGAPVSRSTAGQTAGNAGTISRVYNAALSFDLRAYPGQPGAVAAASGYATGGAGGTGGGVDYPVPGAWHFPGGPGGTASSASFGVAGGGAVNILGWTDPTTRLVGGSMNTGSGGAGGAGVGGKGGDKNTATASSFSPGGGAGGPGDDALSSAATAGPNAAGLRVQASMSSLASPASFLLDYFGGGGYTTVAPGPGGGSSGDTAANMKACGLFGGMGGAFSGSNVSTLPQPGFGSPGAGLHVTTGLSSSGRGGAGYVVLLVRPASP